MFEYRHERERRERRARKERLVLFGAAFGAVVAPVMMLFIVHALCTIGAPDKSIASLLWEVPAWAWAFVSLTGAAMGASAAEGV